MVLLVGRREHTQNFAKISVGSKPNVSIFRLPSKFEKSRQIFSSSRKNIITPTLAFLCTMARTKQTSRKNVFNIHHSPSSSVNTLWPTPEKPAPMTCVFLFSYFFNLHIIFHFELMIVTMKRVKEGVILIILFSQT
jgi:hypothetical protein